MSLPLILLTNDDGYRAAGLQALVKTVASLAEIYIVAPDGARSGTAAAISCTTPVSFQQLPSEADNIHVFSCSGTPVDCVKLAMEQILPRRPDLLLSGINHGDNASVSIHYSGTMGAVFEGCIKAIPSIGLSLHMKRGQRYEDHPVSEDTLAAIADLCRRVLNEGLPQDVCLNVNLPTAHTFLGWQICRQTRGEWSGEWVSAHHPYGQNAFWLTGTFTDLEPEATDTDFAALRAGYCSIVPITIDMTAYTARDYVQKMLND